MITNIAIPREAVQGFCQRWNISELALFGSVLRGDFRPDSDVDVLVRFAPDARWTLLDFVRMRDELSEILERKIDLESAPPPGNSRIGAGQLWSVISLT
jgi:predicted nucleotidyltransferase